MTKPSQRISKYFQEVLFDEGDYDNNLTDNDRIWCWIKAFEKYLDEQAEEKERLINPGCGGAPSKHIY